MSPEKSESTFSIIIPTLNGAEHLRQFFQSLRSQTIQPLEIIVGDSCSTDETIEICQKNGAQVVNIPRVEFDHGGTRSLLAKMAKGKFLLFFTQDAILVSNNSIQTIMASFKSDGKIACAYGRQLPHSNATIVAAHLRNFNYPDSSYVREFVDSKKAGLRTIFISNSFAVYKKVILEECDYFKNGLIFGEDTCTLGKILVAGYKVAYTAEACVYHSHNYKMLEEFRRSFDIGVLHSSEKWLIDTFGQAEGEGVKYIRSIFSHLLNEKKYLSMVDCFFRNFLKAIGYKLGKYHTKLPEFLVPHFSMNSLWWSKK